ncbi:DUF2007 domain-containing protein [Allosphingosinicella sp.]|uniref:putative signal transducing protein n=1 Tax=Allosphingosinicella sp. TaxID=2823234 RepID=UPI002FC0E3BA
MALVEAARFHNDLEADLARSRLAAEGIDSVLFDVGMSWVGAAIPVRLMVDEADEDEARRLLSRDRDEWV